MTPVEELDILLKLMRKYDLPLSPILEYAINEKKEINSGVIAIGEGEFPFEEESQCNSNNDYSSDNRSSHFDIQVFNIPDNADTTTQNKYILQFCFGILSDFPDALSNREKDICEKLLVENARGKASSKYNLTGERIRQIFVKSIKKITAAYQDSMRELEALRIENEEVKSRNYLLEKEISSSKSMENVESVQEQEGKLCYNARKLLNYSIIHLPLSVRTINALRNANLSTFREIPQLTMTQLLQTRNCGRKSVTELRDYLSKFSLDFGLKYEEVVARMVNLTNEDISPQNFVNHSANKWEDDETDIFFEEDNSYSEK